MRLMKGINVVRRKKLSALPYQLAVGQVTQHVDKDTREVKVIKMEMNEYLKMYFNKSYVIKTLDASFNSKKGDIVLIRKLDQLPSKDKEFGVEKILFRIDDIVDPITGKKNNYEENEIKKHLDGLIKAFNK